MNPSPLNLPERSIRPVPAERRKKKPACKKCGSFDLWRIAEQTGLIAAFMKFRNRRPFQCRACGYICYRVARRKRDNSAILIKPRQG